MAKPTRRTAPTKFTANLSSKPTSNEPPPPFTIAPSHLTSFLSTLDSSRIYITHIDTHPARFKRRIFTIPILLNLTIALLLLWRLYAAVPTYLSLILSAVGSESSTTINPSSKTWAQLIWIILLRALTFLFDFFLIKIVLPWPVTFFLERPANPISWRWHIGFRDQEIYVRVSRFWGSEELMKGSAKGAESPFFKVRILPAVEEKLVKGKTGYLLVDKYWDLDFGEMIRVTGMLDRKEVDMRDLDGVVWGFQEGLGWVCWRLRGGDEGVDARPEEQEVEEARRKIGAFKAHLTALDKEDLFFRWIEFLQFETSRPSAFTPTTRADLVRQAQQLFAQENINFDDFVTAIGGLDEIPGLEGGKGTSVRDQGRGYEEPGG